eukprot:1152962-Pelagomonas_calceolata.AAC.1
MASQAPSSNPLARWLKPVTPTQRLLADQARLARAQASKKGQPAKQNPLGRPPGNSSVDVECISSSVHEAEPSGVHEAGPLGVHEADPQVYMTL